MPRIVKSNDQLRNECDAMAAYRRNEPRSGKSISAEIESVGFVPIFTQTRTGAVGNPDNIRMTGGKRMRGVDRVRWAR